MKTSLKLLLSAIFFLSIAYNCSAQNENKSRNNELDVDVTSLIRYGLYYSDYLPYPAYPLYSAPNNYLLTYRHYFNKGNALKMGVGGLYNSENRTSDTSVNKYNQKSYNLSFGVGYEKYWKLIGKLSGFTGVDLFYVRDQSKSLSNYNATGVSIISTDARSHTHSFGLQPLLGLQYNFNDRISISSSTYLNLIYAQEDFYYYVDRDESLGYTDELTEYKTKHFKVNYTLPTNLHLRVKF